MVLGGGFPIPHGGTSRSSSIPAMYESLLSSINSYVLIIAGLMALYYGAEWMVGASCSLAVRMGIPPVMVGLTIVAAGTSMPEAVVSVQASMADKGPLALGNVLGSNILNIALVLGIAAIMQPLKVQKRLVKADIPSMILLSVLAFVFFEDQVFSQRESMFLLFCMVSYIVGNIVAARQQGEEVASEGDEEIEVGKSAERDVLALLIGMILLGFGSDWLVNGSVNVAQSLGVSEAVIGLTVVSIGTSSPELATSIAAALRKQTDLAVGNAVGSNIANLCFVIGTAGTVAPLSGVGINLIDFIFMMALAFVMLPTAWTGYELSRQEGVFFVGTYLIYLVLIWPL